jgi:biofilm PGA synthesis N-glycosyltransferase PgaC
MAALFWVSCAIVVYVYLGYPLLLAIWARIRPRPLAIGDSELPGVSIVIAARNEASRLAHRLDNLLQLDYPAARIQIIVVSDGSTDHTLKVLHRYRGAVDVVAVKSGGKALALNAGVRRAKHDILVFADARPVFARDALLELTAPFRDPRVGAVTGELLLDAESPGRRTADRRRIAVGRRDAAKERRAGAERRRTVESTIADGVGLYWQYEKSIRHFESTVGSTLGATGAIYAIRRSLWAPLPSETILDDVLAPMRAVLAGYRTVFNGKARAFDRAASDAHVEMRRKVRTLAGNYQILRLEPRLLLPWRNPVWLQYVSHKIGRLVVPYALVGLAVSSAALAMHSFVYLAALIAQCAFYLLAAYGAWLERGDRIVAKSTAPTPVMWRDVASHDRRGALNA